MPDLNLDDLERFEQLLTENSVARVSLAALYTANRVQWIARVVLEQQLRLLGVVDPQEYIRQAFHLKPPDKILGPFTMEGLMEDIQAALVPYPEFLAGAQVIIEYPEDPSNVGGNPTAATPAGQPAAGKSARGVKRKRPKRDR